MAVADSAVALIVEPADSVGAGIVAVALIALGVIATLTATPGLAIETAAATTLGVTEASA